MQSDPSVDPAAMAEMVERIAQPRPCTADGYTVGGYRQPIWSPAGFIARGDRYVIICSCGARRDAPLAEVVAAGKGDRPMHTIWWKPCACGGSAFSFEAVRASR